MTQAGIEKETHGFAKGPRHMFYVGHGIKNRAGSTDGYKLNRPLENPLKVGDLVCFNRKKGKHTYEGLYDKYVTRSSDDFTGKSHCDIVIDFQEIEGTRFAVTICCNVGSFGDGNGGVTVNKKYFKVDENSKLAGTPTGNGHNLKLIKYLFKKTDRCLNIDGNERKAFDANGPEIFGEWSKER